MRILSEEQAKRWAEIIREKTDYGEKVLAIRRESGARVDAGQ